jgi:hypothetical protein
MNIPENKKASRTAPEGQIGAQALSALLSNLLASVSVQLPGSKRYEMLRPRTHPVDFFDQVSQIVAACDEIDIRGVHYEKRGFIEVKEELIVGLRHL